MAVVYENIENGLVKAYSDKGFYISGGMPTGEYAEAVDPKSENRKYVETETKIPEKSAEIADYQAKLRELGVQI